MGNPLFSEPRVLSHQISVLSALLLSAVSVLLGMSLNFASSRPAMLHKPLSEQPGEIAVADAWRLVNSEGVLFLDAREEEMYRRSHLPGAESLPLDGFEARASHLRASLESLRLIVYCSGPRCLKADQLRDKLEAKGFKRVDVMRKGLAGWMEAGYPLEHR